MITWLLEKLLGRRLDREVAAQRVATKPLDWRPLLERIEHVVDDHSVFLETREGRIVRTDDAPHPDDVVALLVAKVADGLAPWDTEPHADDMRDKLSNYLGTDLPVQLSRETETFAGYYVRIGSEDVASGSDGPD